VDAVMIFLCDQPLVASQSLDRMVESHFNSSNKITAAFYAGTAGTPVVFDSSLFAELIQLKDHQGGKTLIHRHPEMVGHFPLPEAELDIDTKEDFARLNSASPPERPTGN
jgi:molybdenum cofactor cytidylyltransferase